MLKSTKECLEEFGSQYQIRKMIKDGRLYKLEPGVYSDGIEHRTVEIVQFKYPSSVVTLNSAYYYYNLSDSIPDKLHLTMERRGTSILDSRVIEHQVPVGTLELGAIKTELQGIPMRIYDRERLLIETIRNATKLPYDLYKEVIESFRNIKHELYPTKMTDYIEKMPRRDAILRAVEKEVF